MVVVNLGTGINLSTGDFLIQMLRVNTRHVHPAVELVMAPPHLYLDHFRHLTSGYKIKVAGQNLHWNGTINGEVTAEMIADFATYVVIGDNTRRGELEDDESINSKIKAAVAAGLSPIICVGDDLPAHEPLFVLEHELPVLLAGVDLPETAVIVYNPAFMMTAEGANDVAIMIRGFIEKMYGQDLAQKVRILYGGTLMPGHARYYVEGSKHWDNNIDGLYLSGENAVESGTILSTVQAVHFCIQPYR